jgi:hypothetical protein
VQRLVIPPTDSADWSRVAFQPMLYLGTWIAAILVISFGDFTYVAVHPGVVDYERAHQLFWVWNTLALVAPPMALLSLWMITHRGGRTRYRGLWLRLGADMMQLISMTIYLILRITLGDFHIYPITIVTMCTVFVAHLVGRDVKRLRENEQLARTIHGGS